MNLSVSALLQYLKNKLDTDNQLQNVIVAGEISNFHRHQSGHLYFSLKDDKATIACVMFRSFASRINFEPKNGDRVLLKANTSIFEASGQLQLYVNAMKLDGIGDLFLRYEKLKKQLFEEGLFKEEHKKSKPNYPMNIAVLVGDNSAAMSDIKTTFLKRWPLAKVDYYPVLVQGSQAPEDIINNLLSVDEMGYDAIILARGGGSFEDLFAFNDEKLARVIYELKTFIIVGIGHEQDYSIADYVADLRAPTPTATVVMLTPDMQDIEDYLYKTQLNMQRLINNQLKLKSDAYHKLMQSRVFTVDKYLIQEPIMRLEFLKTKLYNSTKHQQKLQATIVGYEYRINNVMKSIFKAYEKHSEIAVLNLDKQIRTKLVEASNGLKRMTILLDAYGFEKVLSRGYSLVLKDGKVIQSKQDMKKDEDYELRMHDGSILISYKEDLSCQKKNSKIK